MYTESLSLLALLSKGMELRVCGLHVYLIILSVLHVSYHSASGLILV